MFLQLGLINLPLRGIFLHRLQGQLPEVLLEHTVPSPVPGDDRSGVDQHAHRVVHTEQVQGVVPAAVGDEPVPDQSLQDLRDLGLRQPGHHVPDVPRGSQLEEGTFTAALNGVELLLAVLAGKLQQELEFSMWVAG